MRSPIPILALLAAASTNAQEAPRLISPGVVSTTDGEYSPTYDPAREELVFMRRTPGRFDYTLYVSRREGDGWSEPQVLPFSGRDRDGGPSFSPDGQRLLFDSRRPGEGVAAGSINVWRVARTATGWAAPELIEPASRNDDDEPEAGLDEFGPLETADGTVYFYSFRRPLRAGAHYAVSGNREVTRDIALPDPSAATFVGYLTLSATGDLAVIEGRSRRGRDTDLFYSCRIDNEWTSPEPIDAVNSASGDGTPYLTSDGQTLLFASDRPTGSDAAASTNLYSIDTGALGIPCGSGRSRS